MSLAVQYLRCLCFCLLTAKAQRKCQASPVAYRIPGIQVLWYARSLGRQIWTILDAVSAYAAITETGLLCVEKSVCMPGLGETEISVSRRCIICARHGQPTATACGQLAAGVQLTFQQVADCAHPLARSCTALVPEEDLAMLTCSVTVGGFGT